jgi:hypothetical protein
MITRLATIVMAMATMATPVFAHGGGLDANGCHNDRKRGGYHCHRSSGIRLSQPVKPPAKRKRLAPATVRDARTCSSTGRHANGRETITDFERRP